MRQPSVLDLVVVLLAVAAAGAGLASSYEGSAAAVLVLGMVLSLRAILYGDPVRRWALPRGRPASRVGPVTSLVATLRSAKQGSYFSQAQIGLILRSASTEISGPALPKEVVEPMESAPTLKGNEYLSKIESALRVLKNE